MNVPMTTPDVFTRRSAAKGRSLGFPLDCHACQAELARTNLSVQEPAECRATAQTADSSIAQTSLVLRLAICPPPARVRRRSARSNVFPARDRSGRSVS